MRVIPLIFLEKKMKWYAVKKEYIDYLKKWDKKIPNVDYGNRMKCFIGVIFIKNDIEYFAPLTSFKEKFITMKNDIDFYKITNYETGKIYGAIDINNMIPIPKEMYTEITFENLESFREFKNKRDKKQYWKLLSKEIDLIDEHELLSSAEKLYRIVTNHPESYLAKRCCNFRLLEEKYLSYKK